MMLRTASLLALALATSLPAPALARSEPSAAAATSNVVGLRMVDTEGRVRHLGMDGLTQVGPVALVFLDPGCPIAQRYAPRLNEIAAAAAEGAVEFYGVVSDPTLSPAEARAYADEYELAFPVLFDAAGELAHRLAPERVPEAFVLSSTGRLVYRGRIDDRFEAVGKLRANVGSHELLDAITALGGGGGSLPEHAEPVGCVFEAWDGERTREVSYHREVAPILAASCVECHRDGDVAPFALTSYEDARRRAKTIAEVCSDGFMPPWFADTEAGLFRDERGLGQLELEVLRAWAAAGAPEGDPAEALPPPPLAEERWRLGEPDLLVEMPVAYEVAADGDDVYRYFVIPNELAEERAIVAIDFRPGDPAVVHHCIAYIDRSGIARMNDEVDDRPGFSVFGKDAVRGVERFEPNGLDTAAQIAGWAPGTQPYRLPEGMGTRLEPGGDFVLEVHYHPNGKPTTDRSAMALYFADGPVERYTSGLVIGTENISIPPGDESYWRHVWMEVPHDLQIVEVSPHMHYLGKRVDVIATLPDGYEEPLIQIDSWDFRWQGAYFYRQPVSLPKGSRIDAYFEFDNSASNPSNPSSPPIRVQEGWRTTDEMCLFYFSVIPEKEEHLEDIYRAMYASFGRSGAME